MNDVRRDKPQPVPPDRQRPPKKLPPDDAPPGIGDGPEPVEDPRPDRPERRG